MTDNEIIKALECCSRHGSCEGCPYADDECITAEGESILMKETLDLIKSQQAEIERLQLKVEVIQEAKEQLEKDVFNAEMNLDGKDVEIMNLKHEIERLQKAGEEAVSCFTRMESLYKIKCKELEIAKSEAIKEFAERLKKETFLANARGSVEHVLWIDEIDNLVKEMVGDSDA